MSNDIETSVGEHLYGTVLESRDIESFLNALAIVAVRDLSRKPGQLLCGITLVRKGQAGTVASSSQEAQELDEIQYALREGPCLTSARDHAVVEIKDLRQETRWADYARHVLPYGILSVLSVPFDLEHGDSAALNLYSREPWAFGPQAVRVARDYAARASLALSLATRLANHRDAEQELLEGFKTRTTIDLAVGILMGKQRCTQEEAFGILRATSTSRRIKLREAAASIIGETSPETDTTHFES